MWYVMTLCLLVVRRSPTQKGRRVRILVDLSAMTLSSRGHMATEDTLASSSAPPYRRSILETLRPPNGTRSSIMQTSTSPSIKPWDVAVSSASSCFITTNNRFSLPALSFVDHRPRRSKLRGLLIRYKWIQQISLMIYICRFPLGSANT